MVGLMGVTAFLSMWINNSAATSIMIPAAVAIIDELQRHEQQRSQVSRLPTILESSLNDLNEENSNQLKTGIINLIQ